MNRYVPYEQVEAIFANQPKADYPHYANNIVQFPPVSQKYNYAYPNGSIVETSLTKPVKVVVESMHYLGKEPKRVIDLGCEGGRHALYLAMHGHHVTAIDSDADNLEYTREAARGLGIPNQNFVPIHAKIEDYSPEGKYDGVYATMILHFLGKVSIGKAVRNIHDMTSTGGINVVSAYGQDNPADERTVRKIQHMFEPNELSSYYNGRQWGIKHYWEGAANNIVGRNTRTKPVALIADVVELIAQKSMSFEQRVRGATGVDAEYWRRADPEYFDTLLELYG